MMRSRAAERGLSIIEAIVITTITALLALLIMPMLPRAATSTLAVAQRGLDGLENLRAEREFRRLIRAALLQRADGEAAVAIEGQSSALVLRAALEAPVSCAGAGVPVVRLRLAAGALLCESEGRSLVMARWPGDHAAAFAYSRDGATWQTSWQAAERAPFVRLEVGERGRTHFAWTERAMGDAP